MAKVSVSLDFTIKELDETRYYLLEELKHNKLMNENPKKVCRAFSYFEHFLVIV